LHTHQVRGSERSIVAAIDSKADQKLRDDAGHNEELQPDFGSGAPIDEDRENTPQLRSRRTNLLLERPRPAGKSRRNPDGTERF
jgi:hypothetical protein